MYPPNYLQRVKTYREENASSLQEAVRAVKRAYLFELLGQSAADEPTKTILQFLIENF